MAQKGQLEQVEETSIAILLPSELSDEVEQFAAENPEGVTIEKQPHSAEKAADLGFEPITTIAVTAWLVKFTVGVASGLATKLLVDRILKKVQSKQDGRLSEVQIAFPSGYVLTVRSEEAMTPEQLRKLIEDNIR